MAVENFGLLDLSAGSLAELPDLDEEMLTITLDRLVSPCGTANDNMSIIGRQGRMWQNYRTDQ
jgi:hypothetical protein